MRLPRLTKTEREALRGESTEKHRKALSRLRNLPPPKEAIATTIESLRVYERFGQPHILEALAEAATNAAQERDERIRRRLRSQLRPRRIERDEVDRIDAADRKRIFLEERRRVKRETRKRSWVRVTGADDPRRRAGTRAV